MKTISSLLFIVLTLILTKTHSQTNYSFSHSSETYSALTGSTSLNNGQVWSGDVYSTPIGFTFNFYGNDYTNIFVDPHGSVAFDSLGENEFLGFMADLTDKGNGATSQSPISYLLTGTIGTRILKIEFKNAGFNDAPSDFINFQIWLYETTNKIEVRIGDVNVSDPVNAYQYFGGTGPMIGIVIIEETETDFNIIYSYMLEGMPSSPLTDSWVSADYPSPALVGTPQNGQVYTFNYPTTSINKKHKDGINVSLSPNPVKDQLTINIGDSNSDVKSEVEIYDILGRLVYSNKTIENNSVIIDFSNFEKGTYIAKIKKGLTEYTKKIIKEG